jgi:hypothetical protein
VTIQCVQAAGHKLLFPWHLVYDIPLQMMTNEEKRPCRFLEAVDPSHPAPETPPRCPYEHEHKLDVICPYGFWGFAHWVEMPPTLDLGRRLPLCVRRGGLAHKVVLGLSLELDSELTKAHLGHVQERLGEPERCESLKAFRTALSADERELVYMYCHGRRMQTRAEHRLTSLLEIGHGELIAGDDINQWADGLWGPEHWKDTAPLVLINGCETTAMSPADPGEFVNPFVGAGASGVIGTEVPMDQPVASEVAEELLKRLLVPGATVGSALQGMRRALCAKGNVMGLAYTAYCSASLCIPCPDGQ